MLEFSGFFNYKNMDFFKWRITANNIFISVSLEYTKTSIHMLYYQWIANRNICPCRRKSEEWMNLLFFKKRKKTGRGSSWVWQIDTYRLKKKITSIDDFSDLKTLVTPGWTNKRLFDLFFFFFHFGGSELSTFFFSLSTSSRRMIKKKSPTGFCRCRKTFFWHLNTWQKKTLVTQRVKTVVADGGLCVGGEPAEAEETSVFLFSQTREN